MTTYQQTLRAFALAIMLISLPARAQDAVALQLVSPIYDACPDAPGVVPVMPCAYGVCEVEFQTDGGVQAVPLDWPDAFKGEHLAYLMSDTRAARLACFIGACEKHREVLDQAQQEWNAQQGPNWKWWLSSIVAGILAGAAVEHWIVEPRLKH